MRKLPLPKVGVHGVKSIGYEEPECHGNHPVEFDFPCSQTYRDFEHYQNTGILQEPIKETIIIKEMTPIKQVVHHHYITDKTTKKKRTYKTYE